MSIYKKSEPLILESGVCECILLPNVATGLEGFIRGDEYYYIKKKDALGIYYKIFQDVQNSETCGVTYFHKYFKHLRDEAPVNYRNLK